MQGSEEVELKHLCEQLDKNVDDFFRTLKELFNTRQDLDNLIKDGFLLMARSRYSMGAKSVTSTQYNPDDLQKAFTKVNVLSSPDGDISFQPETSSLKVRTAASGRLKDSQKLGPSSKHDSECIELDQIGCSISKNGQEKNTDLQLGLRRRNLPKELTSADENGVSSDTFEDLVSGMSHINCEAEPSTEPSIPVDCNEYGKDPLLWFGVLVPQALRQSQTAFKQAVELSCRVATLQQRLLQNKGSYKEMMLKKSELVTLLCKMSASVTTDDGKEEEEVHVENGLNTLPECRDIKEAAS